MIANEKQEAESNVHDDYAAKLLKYMNKEASAAQPSQEKKAQPDEVDALVSDLLKQVITESGGSHSKPESAKTDNHHSSIGAQKSKADNSKPAFEASAADKTVAAKTSPAAATSKPETPVFAASAKPKSKAPFIAIACVCALAAIAIPALMFTGSSGNASKTAATTSLPAVGAKSLPAGQSAAVPIVKVVPKYPNLGVRGGISGSVVLDLSIDTDGLVVKSTPVSGNPLFFNTAIETANQWRFKPATTDGKNVASRTKITLYFRP